MAGKREKANIFLHEKTYDEFVVLGKIQHKNKSELMRDAVGFDGRLSKVG